MEMIREGDATTGPSRMTSPRHCSTARAAEVGDGEDGGEVPTQVHLDDNWVSRIPVLTKSDC